MNHQINVYFELAEDAVAEDVRRTLDQRIRQISHVQDVDVQEPGQRMLTGGEVVTIIAAAILIMKSAKDAVSELSGLIGSVKTLVKEIKGLRAVVVETRSGGKKLEEVTAQDLA